MLESLELIPAEAKGAIKKFLQQEPEERLAIGCPVAHAYESQSDGVIEMPETFLGEFHPERTNLGKEKSNSKHADDMLMQGFKTISSGASSGHAVRYLRGLLQTSALAQLRSDTSSQNQQRVASYLQRRA